VAGLVLASVTLALYAIFTPHGSRVLTQLVLSRMLGATALEGDAVEGTWWSGLAFRGLDISDLQGKAPGSGLQIGDGEVASLASMASQGVSFELRDVRLSHTSFAKSLRVASISGTWPFELTLQDVVAEEPVGWPAGSEIEAQRLIASLPMQLERIRAVHNGRLRLPYSDPVIFSGSQIDGSLNLRVFSKAADIGDVLSVLPVGQDLRRASGVLSDVDLSVAGTVQQPTVAGQGMITTLSYRGWTVARAPTVIAVAFDPDPASHTVAMYGRISCSGGTLTAKQTTVQLRVAHVTFDGDPAQPTFDVKGTAAIGGTTITIALKGTRARPDLRLTSDPPLPQGVLLVMLATGKRWRGAQEALTQGVISSDVASDFIDYFIFGGAGARLGKRFGITDLAVTREADTGLIGVKSTIADRLDVGLKTDPASLKRTDAEPSAEAPPTLQTVPYKAELEYKVDGSTAFGIEAQRTPLDPSRKDPASGGAAPGESAPQSDDSVLLKLKKRF